METPRETRVLRAVVTLVDSLLDDFDVVELLTDLTEQCARLLDVEAAGLLLTGSLRGLHLMAATSSSSRDLEMIQLQAAEGPCLDCFATGELVSVPDLAQVGPRWPRFVAAATDAQVVSVHAIPMRAAGTTLGALGLFGTRAGTLSDADLMVAHSLAHVACVALLQEHPRTPESILAPLRSALDSALSSPSGTGLVVGADGELLGGVRGPEVLERLVTTPSTGRSSLGRGCSEIPDRVAGLPGYIRLRPRCHAYQVDTADGTM